MEESEENVNKAAEEINEEESNQEDENETKYSKHNIIEPHVKSDNTKDLKSLDINSADDVRQTLKAVFTSKMPHFAEHTEDYIGLNNNCGDDLLKEPQGSVLVNETQDTLKNDKNSNIMQTKKSMELQSFNKCDIRKRRGRPPKTGPSKRIKKQSISMMYIGKLSNIVFSNRGNDSDSDSDSVIF